MPEEIKITRQQMDEAICQVASQAAAQKNTDRSLMVSCLAFGELVGRQLFGDRSVEDDGQGIIPEGLRELVPDPDPSGIVVLDGDRLTINEAGLRNKYYEIRKMLPGMHESGKAAMVIYARHLMGKWKKAGSPILDSGKVAQMG